MGSFVLFDRILTAAALVVGLALPSAAIAAVERWNISTQLGSPYTASGYIDFDRSTQTVTESTIGVDTGTTSFSYKGRMDGDRLILEDGTPAASGQSLYLVSLTPLKTSTDSPAQLSGYKANCNGVADNRCTTTIGAVPDLPVVAILAPAPAPAPVPTLTEWAMILMAAALAGAAALTLHQRRRA